MWLGADPFPSRSFLILPVGSVLSEIPSLRTLSFCLWLMQNEWDYLQGLHRGAPKGKLRVSTEGGQDWQPDHLENCPHPRILARGHSRAMEQIVVVNISPLGP